MPNWKKVIVSGSDAQLNSLLVSTATTSSTLQVNGDSDFNGKVEIYNSGSTVFDVQGSQGQLFSITDSLSGSLFSVNDISGIPILEVFSDETVKLGTFGDEAIIVNGNTASITGSLEGTASYSDNSDLLDGLNSTQFLRSDESDTMTGNLTVTGNISSSGDLYVDGGIYDNNDTLGTADQVLFTTSTGIEWRDNIAQQAQDLVITGKNLSGGTIAKGTPLYFTGSGTSGNTVGIYPADAGNPNRMPAGGVAGESIADEVEGDVYIYGFIAGVDTSQFNAGDDVFVAVGGGYTNQKPTGSALIQKLGNVEKVDPTNGSGVIQGPSWYNDLPNWEEGKVKVGRDDGQPVTSSVIHLDETNGRMGVGTDSPDSNLEVVGNVHISGNNTNRLDLDSSVRITGQYNVNSGTEYTYLRMYNPSNASINMGAKHPAGYISFEVGNGAYTERMRITNTGRVGIGTTNPAKTLTLEWNSSDTNVTTGNSLGGGSTGNGLKLQNNNTTSGTYSNLDFRSNNADGRIAYQYSGTTNAGDFHFITDNLDSPISAMVIKNNGNVGIGTTSPANKLDVNGGIDADTLNTGQGDNELYAMNQNVQTTDSVTFTGLTVNGNGTVNGDLTITGKVTAEEFHTEFVSSSIIYQSGSTKFGDTQDDKHNFTGSVNITGSLSVNGSSVLTTADEGSGNGLDADTLDGQEGSYYLDFNNHTNKPTLISGSAEGDNQGQIKLNGQNVNTNNLGTDDSPSFAGLTVDTNTLYVDATNNRVGIGTSNPGRSLHVAGNGIQIAPSSGNATLHFQDSGVTNAYIQLTDGTHRMDFKDDSDTVMSVNYSTLRVGIGTTSPTQKLDVRGSAIIAATTPVDPHGGTLEIYNNGANSILTIHEDGGANEAQLHFRNGGNDTIFRNTSNKFIIQSEYITNAFSLTSDGVIINEDSADVDFRVESNNNVNMLFVDGGNDRVGIGTNTPGSTLDVAGNVRFQYADSSTILSSGGSILRLANSNNTVNNIVAIDFPQTSGGSGFSRIGIIYKDRTSSSEDQDMFFRTIGGGSSAEVLRLTSTGNVGIGTTSPTQPLTVEGNISGSGNLDIDGNTTIDGTLTVNGNTTLGNAGSDTLRIYSSDVELNKASAGSNHTIKNTNAASDLILETTSDIILNPTNNVGIGTTSPSYRLDIGGNVASNDNTIAISPDNNGTAIRVAGGNNDVTLLRVGNPLSSDASAYGFSIKYMGSRSGNNNSLSIFSDNENGAQTESLTMLQDGKIGIGTTSPSEKLQVNGNIAISGSNATLQLREGSAELYKFTAGGTSLNMTVNSNNALSIYQNGFIGIGNTSPSQPLTVAGNISGSGNLDIDGNTTIDGTLTVGGNSVLTTADEGSGNGLDADTVDGLEASQFLRNDQSGTLTGDLTVTGKITAEEFHTEFVSASIIYRSGSTQFGDTTDDTHNFTGNVNIEGSGSTVFSVDGSSGRLFSITDDLSDSLFSANTIAGLPVLEVFSDNTVKIGTFNDEAIIVNGNTAEITGSLEGTSSYSDNSDLLDGQEGSYYLDFNNHTNKPTLISGSAEGDNQGQIKLNGQNVNTNNLGTDDSPSFAGLTVDTNTLYVDATNDRVGIGTSSPSQPLTVAGNISGSGNLDIDGDGYVDGTLTAGRIVETSTRELKENIQPLESQKEVIDSLQPVSYTWKEGGEKDFGLIAEDVAEIAPDLVSYDEEGKLKGIKYSKLSVLLLDVVKKQNSVIEELSERITKLETNGGK